MKKIIIVLLAMVLLSGTALAADARYLLNSVPLTPTLTGFTPCDNLVRNTLAQITNDQMTTYDKIKSCYDYLINSCSYGHSTKMFNIVNGYLTVAGTRIPASEMSRYYGAINAYDMLRGHVGVCDDYTCAFAAMARAIGLNCYTINGLTSRADGSMTGHAWCVVNINGTEYVFDPQIDDNIAKGGPIGYHRFCVTYDEVPWAYEPAGAGKYFKPF